MKRIYAAALAVLFGLTAVPVLAADDPPPIRQFDQKTLVLFGRYIYREDQFAWKASDILTAKLSGEQAKVERLNGLWITHLSRTANVVRFLRDGDNGPEAAYDVTFEGDGAGVLSVPVNRTLAPEELVQFRARKLALSSIPRPCSQRYNSVALEDLDGNWLVWTLAATTTPGEMMYGGHYRFTIAKDGSSIVQRDALSRSCMRIPPPDPRQGQAVGAFVTQLVSNIPVETTVWLSLLHKTTLYVGTGEKETWAVSEGTMSRVDNK